MFDTALIESAGSPPSSGRRKSLPLAIGLHTATIAALVGATVWNTGEPPEPDPPVIWTISVDGPPPPPPGRREGVVAPPVRAATEHHEAAALPIEISEPTANASDQQPSGSDLPAPEEVSSEAKGDPRGIPGGTGDAPTGGNGLSTGGGGPIVPDSSVELPRLVTRVEPDYPESMRRAHQEGVVILEAIISADGDVQSVRVLKSVNPILDRAAVDAVQQWRYTPATLGGRRVSVFLSVTVRFGLHA